ncbi:Uncharacterised protein [Mycobacteroides abscessus subsp. abscessus]|uniref:hypothetical protein n=1 Tax=Mycobacteroides abscessus TaxID=36809 RepID=UPI0009295B83|nr:hypothetical protein [Mycobacteroides abscessus]MDO3312380.1 hypothetical protein [Mycobacteroides abscessus subsp. abscessus]MDO3344938.1 hypothetical protein [Mycobacteroides abscessus subsp. abscessus]SHP09772.1 Uncharacterised protein [Mycobacteroides abscessus subsp. abscessus]SHP23744.1 Uncharacterised protein [Mycobacteroides abscessus subsp. abscessus]SHP94631.1 Uncharacterised protein [Mycobacteroides abscessus subsp. abscessus]
MTDTQILEAAAKILNRHGREAAANECAVLIGRMAVAAALGGGTEPEPAPGKRLTRIVP